MNQASASVDEFSAKGISEPAMIEARSTAVLVVDMENDFCVEGGAMVLPGYEKLIGPQLAVIDAARAAGAPVVFITDAHRPGVHRDREFLKRARHCIEGTWGSRVVDALKARPDDHYVIKRRYSGFFGTDLDMTLKDLEVDSVVVMGVVTNICVRSTVHDAFFLGYRVFVPEDCVAAPSAREQASSLFDIATSFGWVSDSAEVARAYAGQGPIRNRFEFA
ncbi:Peroxyureidoacrylate/ureidoacrylate amidohydrolase RutB [Variovorax sp. SRS16]|uniref:cysteine hydrolase family protein n=1 Tax=Variovorax sp. SRS16 TaxID=282217 RepID=UPI001316934F|nr:isochorismatase family cysteine hydrolase [Variovorax sp. SRS16]VTU22230.1 Peroxyureidoacrylate/ureidoacrylate amidohydrolase RutB [Variovorax sp. SRS16]